MFVGRSNGCKLRKYAVCFEDASYYLFGMRWITSDAMYYQGCARRSTKKKCATGCLLDISNFKNSNFKLKSAPGALI